MKAFRYIYSAVVAALALCGCTDKGLDGESTAHEKGLVNFNIGPAGTKAQYAANDWRQIEWEMNDQVKIFCSNTQAPSGSDWVSKTSGTYSVSALVSNTYSVTTTDGTSHSITNNSKATLTASDGLYWSNGEHTFYAGVGDNITMSDISSGVFKCKYNPNQTLSQKNGSIVSMGQAYLVAKTTESAPVENVNLQFKPIMTTLDLEIKGLGSDGDDDTVGDMYIYSVWVTVPASLDKLTQEGDDYYFSYDYAAGDASAAAAQEERVFKFTMDDPNNALVPENGSCILTLILPPMSIASADQLQITVHSAGWGTKSGNITGNAIASGYKAALRTQWTVDYENDAVSYDAASAAQKTWWALKNVGATVADHPELKCNKPTDAGAYYIYAGQTWDSRGTATANTPVHGRNLAEIASYNPPSAGAYWTGPYITKGDLDGVVCVNKDPAQYDMAGMWRLPTKTECDSLVANTTHKSITLGGQKGMLLISKTTDDCIFLPANGYRDGAGWQHRTSDVWGSYWSASPSNDQIEETEAELDRSDWTPGTQQNAAAYMVKFDMNNNISVTNGARHMSRYCRGVKNQDSQTGTLTIYVVSGTNDVKWPYVTL
ncbi:MAG: hypothetical protein HUJ91_05815 [Bacteroidales bacterium]|nr:hypothetical protein [Bacteroidales bacterium]